MHLAQKEQNTGVGDSYAPLATQNELNEFCDSSNGMGMVGGKFRLGNEGDNNDSMNEFMSQMPQNLKRCEVCACVCISMRVSLPAG